MPIITQIFPMPPQPEPGAAEKPWNYTKTDERADRVPVKATSFGDHNMPMLPERNSYRNERSLTAESRNTLSLPEGTVALEVPENLCDDSYDDLKDWIELMFKRIERRMKRAKEAEVE